MGGVAAERDGVAQLAACPLGTFQNSTGQQSRSLCHPCTANYFCPSPTLRGQCPAGTVSNASSTSQLDCKCVAGYACSYTKVINAVLTLMMSTSDFNRPGVQDTFKEAVAFAAKTTADKVIITKVVQTGSGRRLLSPETHVLLEVLGGSGAVMDRTIGRHLAMAGIAFGGLLWIEPHGVRVLRK